MHVGGPSCGARGQRGHGRTQHTRAACVCAKGSETGVTHFERSARRCQARLSLRGEAAVSRHKSAEHAFRREVVCYPCSSENLSQYRNRDTARYLAIKCDKWRCCAMLAIMRALHSPRPRLSDDATRVKRYKGGRAPSPLRPWRFARSARVAQLGLAGYTPRRSAVRKRTENKVRNPPRSAVRRRPRRARGEGPRRQGLPRAGRVRDIAR